METADFTTDEFLGGKLKIKQPAKGYRIGIDTVLLASATKPRDNAKVLDLGCGVGGVSLCLLSNHPNISVVGIDLDGDLIKVAKENNLASGFEKRFKPLLGSVLDPPKSLVHNTFDVVVTNPPYLARDTSNPSPENRKISSHIETEVDLADWLRFSAKFLRPRGVISLIHRADRLDHILALMRMKFGGLVVCPLWPKAGHPAKRVIIFGTKGSASPIKIMPGIILHNDDGSYTTSVLSVLTGKTLLADLLG